MMVGGSIQFFTCCWTAVPNWKLASGHPPFLGTWACLASQVALVVKNMPASAADVRDMGLISGLGRSPGEGQHNPLQYPCLENPVDRGAWWATVHSIAKSQTRQKRLSRHSGRALPDPLPRSSFGNLSIFGWAGSSLLPGLCVVAMWGLLSSCSTWASHCGSVSCCGPQALEHGLSSCGTQA